MNTMHYKSAWTTKWTDVGIHKFHDGLNVSFFEAQDAFPYIENEKYSAVSLKLKVKYFRIPGNVF